MCAICKDWLLGKLTANEAWRNLNESKESLDQEDPNHYFEVAEMLSEKEYE